MRGLKTAVKIWKKEIEFKFTTWGIKEEQRTSFRKMRQGAIKVLRMNMVQDLLNRHKVGDLQVYKEDLDSLHRLRRTPVMKEIEDIYKKYL
jgi:molybdopterin synthase catalytic subunit